MWTVALTPEAEEELATLPSAEEKAMRSAIRKLQAVGDQLGAPHSSSVRGTTVTLRELRPRRGSSPYRAFYRRIDRVMVIGAIGPEAQVDRRGFDRAVSMAIDRLSSYDP